MDPLAVLGPPPATLEPGDLEGWWIWFALAEVWRFLTLLGDAAPWLAAMLALAIAGLFVLLRIGTKRRAAARAETGGQPADPSDSLADVGFGDPRD